MLKKCFFCGSKNVVRNGLRGRTQRYKCKDCGRRFDGGIRRDKSQVITDYVEGKQTLEQLEIRGYDKDRLDISKCDKLWYLDCGTSRMKEIAISNKSALREVIFWDHCSLNERSLRFINKVLDNNNGSLTITPG